MLVSVIIPCYNSEEFLYDTVMSVLNQTYKNVEVILINDGSKDNTWNIIESLMEKDNRVKGFNQENKGVSAARNYGIEVSSGEYIAFLDSDDIYMPEKLEKQILRIKETGRKICYCGNNYVFSDKMVPHIYSEEGKILSGYILNTLMIHLNDWIVEAKLIKDNDIKFPVEFKYGEDVNFFMKVLSMAEACSVNEILTNYYIRESSSSFKSCIRNNDENNYISDYINFINNCNNSIYTLAEKNEIIDELQCFLLPQVIIRNVVYLNKKYKELSEFEKKTIKSFKFSFKNVKSSVKFYILRLKIR